MLMQWPFTPTPVSTVSNRPILPVGVNGYSEFSLKDL